MTASYIQEDQYTEVVSPLTGRKIYRNDSDDAFLLSPESTLAKIRLVCNRVILGWTCEDYWPKVNGTPYGDACDRLVALKSKADFAPGFNGLIEAIQLGLDQDAEIVARAGFRRRLSELGAALWAAGQIAFPGKWRLGNDDKSGIDLEGLRLGKQFQWIPEIEQVSASSEAHLRRRAAINVWRLASTSAGIQEAGDIVPSSVRVERIQAARGLAAASIRPLLTLQRRLYGDTLTISEHDWGLGRGKFLPHFDFSRAMQGDESLSEWRKVFEKWMGSEVNSGLEAKRSAIVTFFKYLAASPEVTRDPLRFVSRAYVCPISFEAWVDDRGLESGTRAKAIGQVANFFDWYVDAHLAMEDDFGRPVRSPQLFNPIVRRKDSSKRAETAREALPIRYLRELVHIVRHDDFAWARQFKQDYVTRFDAATQTWIRVWCPLRAYAVLLKLHLPLRTYQVLMLDSGEADTMVYRNGKWEQNSSPLAPASGNVVQRGFLRRYRDHGTGTDFTGFYVNTNKTADRFKDAADRGYEIPWQHDEAIALASDLAAWQTRYNPLVTPTRWVDVTLPTVRRTYTPAQLASRGVACFLFRDPRRAQRFLPVQPGRIQQYWCKLLDELERRVAARGEALPNGDFIRFIAKRNPNGVPMQAVFDLHSLRVSILTALSVEGGVPLSVLSKCVAGHASVVMTLYYLKQGPAHISQQLSEAQARMQAKEQENYLRFLQDCDISKAESVVAFNDKVALDAVSERNSASWSVGDLGICPVGGALCHVGGPKLTSDIGRLDYQPTPGGPRNCVRCRFFLTGPAFLGGLVAHFNSIGIEVLEASDRMRKVQGEIGRVEDELFGQGAIDSDRHKLDSLYGRHEGALVELDEIANNWHATFTLIERARVLLARGATDVDDGSAIRLVAGGNEGDVVTALQEASPFALYDSVCQRATIYPAKTAPVATLRRGRLLDAMLARNDKPPIFAALSDGEALLVGNAMVAFLRARVGDSETERLIAGTRMLESAGLSDALDSLLADQVGVPARLLALGGRAAHVIEENVE
ncbi:gamma-mobile-trio integrase GmtZ [Ralstonia nicotianae]